MADLLSRKSYRQVVKGLDRIKKQNDEDRKENPNLIPPGWGSSLRPMIEHIVRENRERCHRELSDQVLEYLVKKKLLVRYAGDYTFPTNEHLPSKKEIEKEVLEYLGK